MHLGGFLMRILLLILGCGFWACQNRDTETTAEHGQTYGVVESFPSDYNGKWSIGGRDYHTTDATEFDFDVPPRVGYVSRVDFETSEGKVVALAIKPQEFRPEEVNDGPYRFLRGDNRTEVIEVAGGRVTRREETAPTFSGLHPAIFLAGAPAPPGRIGH